MMLWSIFILSPVFGVYLQSGTNSQEVNVKMHRRDANQQATNADYIELKKVLQKYIAKDPGRHITHFVRMSFHDLMNFNPSEGQGVRNHFDW